MIKSGQSWAGLFTTHDSTGALATPSVGPVGTLYIDGVSNAVTVTITGINPYTFSVTLPTLTAGQRVEMYIAATIASIATSCVIASEQADTSLVSEVGGKVDTVDNLVDDLENRLSADRAGYLDKLNVSGVLAHSDAAGTYKADVSGMATTAHLQEVEDKLDIVDGVVDNILVDTGTDIPAQFSALGTEEDLADAVLEELLAEHTTPGSLGASIDGIVSDVGTEIPASVSAIKAKTDNLPALPADEATLTAIKGDNWSVETLFNLQYVVNLVLNYVIPLFSDWYNGGRLDLLMDAIKAKTDNLPMSPSAVGSAMTLTSGERTAIANEVENQIINETDAEKVLTAITDKIASVNPSLDDLTLAGIASAVRTALAAELARLDVAVSTRLAASGYTVPANVDISAIKTITDKLDTTLEADGTVHRFTQNALENSPTSGDISALVQAMEDLPGDIYEELARIPAISIGLPQAGEFNAQAGDSVSFVVSGLGSLANVQKIYMSVKTRKSDPDSASILMLERSVGLLRINGAVATAGNGSLVVTDEATGIVEVKLEPSESIKIVEGTYYIDVKVIEANDDAVTRMQGEITFYYDITKAVA